MEQIKNLSCTTGVTHYSLTPYSLLAMILFSSFFLNLVVFDKNRVKSPCCQPNLVINEVILDV